MSVRRSRRGRQKKWYTRTKKRGKLPTWIYFVSFVFPSSDSTVGIFSLPLFLPLYLVSFVATKNRCWNVVTVAAWIRYHFGRSSRRSIRRTIVRFSASDFGCNPRVLLEFEEECTIRSSVAVLGNGRGAAVCDPLSRVASSPGAQAKLYQVHARHHIRTRNVASSEWRKFCSAFADDFIPLGVAYDRHVSDCAFAGIVVSELQQRPRSDVERSRWPCDRPEENKHR